MAKNTKPATDALEILHGRFYEGKPSKIRDLEDARANEEIARNILQLRTAAGLTQSWLALVLSGRPRRRSRVWGIKLRSVLFCCSCFGLDPETPAADYEIHFVRTQDAAYIPPDSEAWPLFYAAALEPSNNSPAPSTPPASP